MKTSLIEVTATAMAIVITFGASAQAGVIPVVNPSFEILPAGGLTYDNGIGPFSVDAGIPGWTTTGYYGEWQPNIGQQVYAPSFNYLPDGPTVAYTNGGTISQTVGVLAQAGETYTLQVDVGFRQDWPIPTLDTIALDVGSHTVIATGTPSFGSGNWANYTATYTATAADAGAPISIVLASPVAQGDFDNVRLTDAVPEPANWVMLMLGVAMIGFAVRRRSADVVLAA